MPDDETLAKLKRAERQIERAIAAIENIATTMTPESGIPDRLRTAYSAKCRRAQSSLQDMYWRLQELERKLEQ